MHAAVNAELDVGCRDGIAGPNDAVAVDDAHATAAQGDRPVDDGDGSARRIDGDPLRVEQSRIGVVEPVERVAGHSVAHESGDRSA